MDVSEAVLEVRMKNIIGVFFSFFSCFFYSNDYFMEQY